jgi:hypothetical protein
MALMAPPAGSTATASRTVVRSVVARARSIGEFRYQAQALKPDSEMYGLIEMRLLIDLDGLRDSIFMALLFPITHLR